MRPFRSWLVAALALAAISCTTSPNGSSPSTTSQASAEPRGSIAGHLAYPAEGIPPMVVYAIRVGSAPAAFYTTETIMNQQKYTILGVPAGSYEVYATPALSASGHPFPAAYTRAIGCGLSVSCTDHSVIPVALRPGQAVTGIDPDDFYAPANAFRVIPPGGPVPASVANPSAQYADPQAAAKYEARRGTEATQVNDVEGRCPPNVSCAALGQRHDGTSVVYFIGQAGSNSDLVACAYYVFQDASGWHPLNTACETYPAPGRSVTATFMGSGCINARENPGYTSKILQCVPVDTVVSIDGGPIFVQETTASDAGNLNRVWWHLAGRGWMVHQYLTWGATF
jgi:hypothetical protein